MLNKFFNKTFVALVMAVSVVSGGVSAQVPAAPAAAPSNPPTKQLIIKFSAAPQREAAASELSALAGEPLSFVRVMADGSEVWRLTSAKPQDEVDTIARRVSGSGMVAYAQADAIMQAMDRPLPNAPLSVLLNPNDPRFGEQWHYKAPSSGDYGIDAVGAWDITTGSSAVNVAVIDSGALFGHPDMAGKWLPGYDMISDPEISNDGDARDSDASDPGDWTAPGFCSASWPGRSSTWHGTHVAGTIGAATNNGTGVAGVSWQSKVLPVRALGRCGGYLSDISDAMYWAVGLPVPGAPANPNPARVINMSLGGSGSCSAAYQNAVTAVRNAGGILVVAAGNENTNASTVQPASCSGVIAIAATGRQGNRAYYSNYGSVVALAAPGGDQQNADEDGILSTINTSTTSPGAMGYEFMQGTSMASPHVAGIVALMLARNNSLTADQVKTMLQQSVTPFPGGSTCNTSLCGAGIANAKGAVLAAGGVTPPAGRKLFLPLLTKAGSSVTPPGNGSITGLVTEYGSGVSGLSVALMRRTGSSDTQVSTATTNDDGRYTFSNVPALSSGQSYFVKYQNNSDSSRLFLWQTALINSFSASSSVDVGSFSVENVLLLYPSDGNSASLPALFLWLMRSETTDSYALRVYGNNNSPYYRSSNLGYETSYELTGLPSGFSYNTQYGWDVLITAPDGGAGISYELNRITFTP